MAGGAADVAGVGDHGLELQRQALEDARVGLVHDLIEVVQAGFVDMEGIAVLHQKFARAHDAEARSDFVAELGLDLVETHRQLLVRAKLGAGEFGDHFLVGRAECIFATGPVVHLEQ